MTIQERAEAYNQAFPQYPDSHFKISQRWISATWVMGNNYKGSGFYGSYPPGYIKRVYSMFPEGGLYVLHLFSGSLTQVNVNKEACFVYRLNDKVERGIPPDYTLDAERFSDNFFALSHKKIEPLFDVIFADPPYSKSDAAHYGVKLCNKKKVMHQCHLVMKSGGLLFWMDTRIPMYSKKYWKWVGVISMYRSTNHRIRGVMIFEKVSSPSPALA